MANKYKGYLFFSVFVSILTMVIMHFVKKPEPRSWSQILIELFARVAITFVLILFYNRIATLYLRKKDD